MGIENRCAVPRQNSHFLWNFQGIRTGEMFGKPLNIKPCKAVFAPTEKRARDKK